MWERSRDVVLHFDRYIVPVLLGPWIPDLVDSVEPGPGERVLDIACGTCSVSRIAKRLVGSTGEVVGLDLNPEMLHVAQTIFSRSGVEIGLCAGNAEALPFADEEFDIGFCSQGFQFFGDRPKAMSELHRVLRPGGRVGLVVWGDIKRNPYFFALNFGIEKHIGTEAAEIMRSSFSLCDPKEVRSLFEKAGFMRVRIEKVVKNLRLPPLNEFIPKHLGGTSLAEAASAIGGETRARLVQEVAEALGADVDDNVSTTPFETLLAIGYS